MFIQCVCLLGDIFCSLLFKSLEQVDAAHDQLKLGGLVYSVELQEQLMMMMTMMMRVDASSRVTSEPFFQDKIRKKQPLVSEK